MTGQVLDYSFQTNSGIISGDDGNRYTFTGSDWNETANPSRGMRVDFEAQGANAVSIYRALGAVSGASLLSGEKNRIAAGVLAIVIGAFGVHKFYLGFTKPAVIQAVLGGLGFFLSFVIIGIPILMAMSAIGLVEGIIYLTKSDEDFERIYVVEKKEWF